MMRNKKLAMLCMVVFLMTGLLAVAAYDYDEAPIEDAYVDQVRPDETFDTTMLQIQGYGGDLYPGSAVDSVQRIFLKFDLETLNSDKAIGSAEIGLYLNSESFAPSLKLYHVGDGWDESITWNSSLSLAEAAVPLGAGEQVDGTGKYYEANILPHWDSGDVADGYVSYMLTVTHEGINNSAYFNSRENSEFQPYLRINYIPEPATMILLGLGCVLVRKGHLK